ncbi:MAG: carbamoyl-phosphate synthase large subunit [Rhodospirillaceae bacterium]|nr:carbamoyl-phosphate synthase large subunit [Rhodospirillaceae bacterium]
MPKRTDLKSILIIGAGPIIIGQACEFDYSGVQACKALKEEGYRIILINSNPATIMTDLNLADATYIEPITVEMITKIIEKEHPDALLPTVGGQTALNMSMILAETGILNKHGVEMLSANHDIIALAENRFKFRDTINKIGLETPRSYVVCNLEDARRIMNSIGLPSIIRPSFTLAGSGGGIAYNLEEFEQIVINGLATSPIHEILVEESVLGWKEYEMEVIRDKNDNCIIVCSIENIDPMGVHTGDSITVAPALTLTDKEYQIMRNASIAILREIGIDTGGSNVQFAINPKDGRMLVIEMNPRVSRSSALASKATGFPIAKIATKLAIGYTLDELLNDITDIIPASFEPTIDYIVTKIPRFTFEKFPGSNPILTTSMKSVGETMGIGRTFQESIQKCLCSTETGLTGLNDYEIPNADNGNNRDAIKAILSQPRADRLLIIAQALRYDFSIDEIHSCCSYDPWFIKQIKEIVETEKCIRTTGLPIDMTGLLRLKKMGFSDERLAELSSKTTDEVTRYRETLNVKPVFKRIDACASEFPSNTPYMYSCYEGDGIKPANCESDPTDRNKIIILGGGPNRIGQGIEFDYCCVHAAYALSEVGFETIMVNCNPETVSTDYDTSDRLYFERLTSETVIELVHKEQSKGHVLGVIVQFGGQTPLKLATALEKAKIPILGTSPNAIDLAEDRQRFHYLLQKIGLKQTDNGIAQTLDDAKTVANTIGYPVVIRPSYVLGGRAMRIVYDSDGLTHYIKDAMAVNENNPLLIDRYLSDAIEVDVDCLADTNDAYVAGIMEHIEEAGIHSGDSACSLPPYSLSLNIISEIKRQTKLLARSLNVIGLMNVQFAIKNGDIYILEVNPRASRTIPFVSKATGIEIAKIASRIMSGESLASFKLRDRSIKHVAVKEAVFPFKRFPGVDILLGPEMKSTGEVMGIDSDFPRAFAKSQLGCGINLPISGTVFLSVRDPDKPLLIEIANRLILMGFKIIATNGTATLLLNKNINVKKINKVLEGRPHCVDAMLSNQVQLVINTTEGSQAIFDSLSIRRTALIHNIPHYTTIAGANAAVGAIEALRIGTLDVASLQSYFINHVNI